MDQTSIVTISNTSYQTLTELSASSGNQFKQSLNKQSNNTEDNYFIESDRLQLNKHQIIENKQCLDSPKANSTY